MSVKTVTDAVSAAVRRADDASGRCLIKPTISYADATKIAAAVGENLDQNERSALTKMMKQVTLSDAGTSALQGALNKPALTAEKRKSLIVEKRKELRDTAASVCGSAFARLFLPGSCMVTGAGAAFISDARVAELID
jgi:hypothetical protein